MEGFEKHVAALKGKIAVTGFDGSMRTTAKIVRSKDENGTQHFTKLTEFGQYILEKRFGSFSLEVEDCVPALQGTAPAIATTLANIGLTVSLVSDISSGWIASSPVNTPVPNTSSGVHTVESTSFEFEDSTLDFFIRPREYKNDWERIKDRFGLDSITSLVRAADLLFLCGNSIEVNSKGIMEGLTKDLLLTECCKKDAVVFFDFTSSTNGKEVYECIQWIQNTKLGAEIVISLKEEDLYAFQTSNGNSARDVAEITFLLRQKTKAALLVHYQEQILAISPDGSISWAPIDATEDRALLNASFAAAMLISRDIRYCLNFSVNLSKASKREAEERLIKVS